MPSCGGPQPSAEGSSDKRRPDLVVAARSRDASRPPAVASPVEDTVTGLLGVWLIGALFADGWAHFNVAALENFFTP